MILLTKTSPSCIDHTRTYVLRIWLEDTDTETQWRGYLTNALSREQVHIQSIEALMKLIETELDSLIAQTE